MNFLGQLKQLGHKIPILKKSFTLFFGIVTWFPTLILLFLAAALARFCDRKMDVGLGPEPLLNNVYHKRALNLFGYAAETYVSHTYFITQSFDYSLAHLPMYLGLTHYWLFVRALFTYRALYIYFNGGPLGWTHHAMFESVLYKIANVKVVVMPYGGDVHDLSLMPNLPFKHSLIRQYPLFQRERRDLIIRNVRFWSLYADHVISGCDWVDFMFHWDTLMSAHFSVDMDAVHFSKLPAFDGPIRILHAPNHRFVKGSDHVIRVVDKIRKSGKNVELVLIEGKPNEVVLAEIRSSHIVVDQILGGWHGLFALEAMAVGRPVVCFLRDDFLKLYRWSGAIPWDVEIPLVSADPDTLESVLRSLIEDIPRMSELATRSRQYVERMHSLDAVGKVFAGINSSMGIFVRENRQPSSR
ncbi:hypothetical protein BH10BDE1_BH10BDE1_34450 [soil metagenome]